MIRADSRLVATSTAWAALAVGALLAALSLPIDDFWLSLASGRAIGAGADPTRAIGFTWIPTVPGALNPQWGAQLLLAAPGSAWGVLALNAALIAVGLVVTLARVRRGASPPAVAIAMLLMMGALAPHLLARAQSFSIALLPLALLLLERRPHPRWLPVAYGLLLVVWANLHGAFVIGQLAAVAFGLDELVRWRRGGEPSRPRVMLLTVVAAAIAPLVNPVGAALLAYAYGQPGLDVVRSISVEWQPAWPWMPVGALFWCYLLLLVVGRVARRGGVSLVEGLIALPLAVFAATSVRQVPWFLLATAPLLAADVAALLAAAPRLGRAIGEVGGPLGGRRMSRYLAGAALLVLLAQPIRTALPEAVGRVTLGEPVAVVDLLERALPAGARQRILNEQVWGGYLVYRLGDRVATAMDGRLEIRSRAAWASYFALLHGDGDPAAELAADGVGWAVLMPTRQTLLTKLAAAGWTTELETPDAILLRRG